MKMTTKNQLILDFTSEYFTLTRLLAELLAVYSSCYLLKKMGHYDVGWAANLSNIALASTS